MRVLCIGNSFSQDAARYLHQIAAAAGVEVEVWNLYIGGCSLEKHWDNMEHNVAEYLLEINGRSTEKYVTVQEMLVHGDWDVVTMQQVSNCSVDYSTYQPFLDQVNACVKQYAPAAKRLIHQTWAYEPNSERLIEEMGYQVRQEMFRDLEQSYQKAAKAIRADGIIPSGAVFEAMQGQTKARMYRDGFHASLGIGRYALGLLWYGFLTGNLVKDISFTGFDDPIAREEKEQAEQVIRQLLAQR